jgi:methionine-rich copper-binding protein CopC
MLRLTHSITGSTVRRATACAALVLASATAATGALAMRHLRLVRSFPAASAVLTTSPDAVRLWLSEPPELKLTKIALTDAKGGAVKLGPVTSDSAKGTGAVAKIATRLPNGAYNVSWRTMSKDGHVVKGTFAFKVGAAASSR